MEPAPGRSVKQQPALAPSMAPEGTLPLLPPHFQFRPRQQGLLPKLGAAEPEGDSPAAANSITPGPVARGRGGG